MTLLRVGLAALLACAVATASADITPIGEFTGDMAEGFENIYSPGGYPGPIPVFNGGASLDDTLAHTVVISFIWSGAGGEVLPYNGNLFGGAVAGPEVYTFETPLVKFGGYFTTVGALGGGTVNFYDGQGGLVGSTSLDITPAQWGWLGWMSDVPFTTIELVSANVPGVSVQCDDLQATFVPEPGAVGLIAVGASLLLRRRR